MLDIVLWFAAITALGEFIIIHSLNARVRAWILRSSVLRNVFHIGFAALNLWIHWGTVTGSMTAVTAFVVSVVVLRIAEVVYLGKLPWKSEDKYAITACRMRP
jgi:hypothetical protein